MLFSQVNMFWFKSFSKHNWLYIIYNAISLEWINLNLIRNIEKQISKFSLKQKCMKNNW